MGGGIIHNLTANDFKTTKQQAENGNAIAQLHLGMMYLYGQGVNRDTKKAMELFKQSAENGNEYATEIMEHLSIK